MQCAADFVAVDSSLNTKGTGNHVAYAGRARRAFCIEAIIYEVLQKAVVMRELFEDAAPKQIKSGVADMGNV